MDRRVNDALTSGQRAPQIRPANPFAARDGSQNSPPAPTIPWNPALEMLLTHRSVRAYSGRRLPAGLLELRVAAAQSAPSSSNLQAFSIVAVEDAARKARLARLAASQRHVVEAPLLLLFVADLARLRQVAAACGETARAAQNTPVALELLGLDGCYIGAMRNHPQEVARELGMPDRAVVVFGLTIGYSDPAVETGIKPRLDQAIVLHRECYAPGTAEALTAYDEVLRGSWLHRSMPDTFWTQQATRRIRSASSLMWRHVLQTRSFPPK